MEIPQDLRFTDSHEWIRDNGDGTVDIGITAYAQEQLGDVVYWDAPEVGENFETGDTVGTVESVKAVSDVYTPVGGEIAAVNEALEDAAELVNDAPYTDGWMFRVKLSDPDELNNLMDAAAYQALVDGL